MAVRYGSEHIAEAQRAAARGRSLNGGGRHGAGPTDETDSKSSDRTPVAARKRTRTRLSLETDLLPPKLLARRWHLSHRTLERWRSQECGPPYVRLLGRVLYRLEDIERYERTHLCVPEASP
jgi:hypothetical protein